MYDVVEVKPSDINGFGVFSVNGASVEDEDFIHGFLTAIGNRYTIEHDKELQFEPYAPYKFLNHSDNPNCELIYDDEWGYTIGVIEEIDEGGELTIDYGYPQEEWYE